MVGRGVLGRLGGDGHWAVGPVFFWGGQQLFLLNSFHLICVLCAGLPKRIFPVDESFPGGFHLPCSLGRF